MVDLAVDLARARRNEPCATAFSQDSISVTKQGKDA